MRHSKGFTLIEVAVAVAIIGILATFTLITFSKQQVEARDSARSSKATIIADALERYYSENGEYPSARALLNTYAGNTGTAVASLLSITEQSILVMPKATSGTTNSITDTLGSTDAIAYVPSSTVGDDNCQASINGGCDSYTLSYKKEADGSTVTINSQQQTRTIDPNSPLLAPNKPTLTLAQSGANMIATASAPSPACASGMTAKYAFRSQASAGAWSAWTGWQGSSFTIASAANGVAYGVQVHVRCESATMISDTSVDSNVTTATYYTMPSAPAAPTVNAAPGSGVTGTTSTVTCNVGTPQYQIDYNVNEGAWSVGTWGTATTRSTGSVFDGYQYVFRSIARCVNGTQTGPASPYSALDSYIDPIAVPGAPTVSGATEAAKNWTWTASSCPVGTTAWWRYQFTTSTGNGAWVETTGLSATNAAATSQGIYYGIYVQQNCYSSYTSSGWGSTGVGGTFVVPVVHVPVQYAALKLLAGGYPSIKVKTFTGNCASGLDRYVSISADYNNTGTYTVRPLIDVATGTSYPTFAPAPNGVILKITSQAVAASGYVEFNIRGHCQNAATGYGQNSGGYYAVDPVYDYGNLHFISTTQYNNSCVPDGPNMYCEAGFDSGGNSGTTNTGAKACNVKTSSNTYINDTNTKWSDRFNLGADNVCWTT